ncbi:MULTISPECIES: hypothetical protein [unclassified Staphylococcus]|uniref:hypothetical protein n=1 Tax=unclassified Staphylococcus TaxID=91994 RepID=UPI0021D21069|nr:MULTISPECIES: hypothetical protein [unclassified Staphylococcus]UXR70050.1 hypothetical protein MUA26_02585 [Staphylococcus sp. IVB6246]UXR72108.1 hypothetical protein MUA88_02660 [Staphylococcus sp. IVB6240]UXR74416.1 hypothetical protein MUA48_02835 [Staphylococcus sp. IVB6238]UXR76801.1 hypothetical protein MUA74_03195 [Staphylococcus sp. IVB6233]UXR80929.1 hypothetical protein MUA65_02805 [Staphylococcus sp. IVB6218]
MKNVFKTVAKAYMISGDLIGFNGIKRNKDRKMHRALIDDRDRVAEDWRNIGVDIQNALDNYSRR